MNINFQKTTSNDYLVYTNNELSHELVRDKSNFGMVWWVVNRPSGLCANTFNTLEEAKQFVKESN